MGKLEFVFLACILGDPGECREVQGPIFGPPNSPSACMLEGPAITGAWLVRNPGWMVREWRCRAGGGIDA